MNRAIRRRLLHQHQDSLYRGWHAVLGPAMHVIDCLHIAAGRKRSSGSRRRRGRHPCHHHYRETFRDGGECRAGTAGSRLSRTDSKDRRGVRRARREGRPLFRFDPSPIEDDIGLVEICHTLGARFMQLTQANQSLLATGCYETEDTGLTHAWVVRCRGDEPRRPCRRHGFRSNGRHWTPSKPRNARSPSPMQTLFWHPARATSG